MPRESSTPAAAPDRASAQAGAATAPHEAVAREARALSVAVLSARRTPEAPARVGREAMERAEAAFAELRKDDESVEREVQGLHCKKYCAHCCYRMVSATPPEIFHLADYIQTTFSAKALAKLKARLRELDRKTSGMTPVERAGAREPCALLVGRLCSAHPARPAICRGFNSRDVGACERALRRRDVTIPVFLAQYRIFAHAHLGVRAGLADCGLSSTHVELTRALRIALETPDAAARWLAGEPVFRAAELASAP
ncbi:MAG: YkgJ family cysteine cluster protein [Kiloniellaceae bacterium]